MTATGTRDGGLRVAPADAQPGSATPRAGRWNRLRARLPRPPAALSARFDLAWALPTAVAAVNALAVLLLAPGVNDIYAALARESAVSHGVGLTYWFAWFGGAAAPASYSVLAPAASHVVGVRVLGALAAVAWTPVTHLALRHTPRARAAVWLATLFAAANLWSGRVPFLLGTVFAVLALHLLRRHRPVATVVAALVAGAVSPVPGAFLALGLVGVFVGVPALRRLCAVTVAALGVELLLVALFFGAPGPEHFTFVELCSCAVPLAVYLWLRPPETLRVTLWLALLACPLLFLIPNGMGANLQRLVWFCLPPVVVAVSREGCRRVRWVALAVLPAVAFGWFQTSVDLTQAAGRPASLAFYRPLAAELDRLGPALDDHRLEVVDDGSHTAAYALLDHAMLARGWETQEDTALNAVLASDRLDATSYKIWLQNNAVGFVAITRGAAVDSAEYRLVADHRPPYLIRVWRGAGWTLYRVRNSDGIVAPPVRLVRATQAALTLQVPCACTFALRVHYSRYLTATTPVPVTPGSAPATLPVSALPTVAATLSDDGFGWTTMTTTRPGTYTVSGSLARGLLH